MFHHVKQAMKSFRGSPAGDTADEPGDDARLYQRGGSEPKSKAGMRIFVSVMLLVAGLAILMAPNVLIATLPDDTVRDAAIGWIGAIFGYWVA